MEQISHAADIGKLAAPLQFTCHGDDIYGPVRLTERLKGGEQSRMPGKSKILGANDGERLSSEIALAKKESAQQYPLGSDIRSVLITVPGSWRCDRSSHVFCVGPAS